MQASFWKGFSLGALAGAVTMLMVLFGIGEYLNLG